MPTMEDYWARDTLPVPDELREWEANRDLPDDPIPTEVFTSADYARRELDGVWMHTWQAACRERELPEPGDHLEYLIGDQGAVVVRGEDGELRAFHNVCLHRGTRLAPGRGSSPSGLRCSFHGWTWNVDGSLRTVPCRWDFPKLDEEALRLRPLQCDTWDGWVFVNFDNDAPPLHEYLGDTIPRHFDRWRLRDKLKAAHVGMIVACNWKVALEAFLEEYHVFRTHPQAAIFSSDANAHYDQYGIHGRMLAPMGVPSPHAIGDIDDEEVVAAMILSQTTSSFQEGEQPEVALPPVGPEESSRTVLAAWNRAAMQAATGVDHSTLSDTEMLDVIQYFVFPNFIPWVGSYPIVYRSRPWGPDPDRCLFEIMLMAPVPAGVELPPDAPLRILEPGQTWSDAPELGGLGPIADQDTENVARMQQGLKSRGIDHVILSDYQENNIRSFHTMLNRYLERYAPE
jgi:phenylpropionate dioxygenase-like ring-hydroxylating dioxygenase large terminal subunit